MKKITLVFILFFSICFNGISQTVSDLGTDWSGTAAVAPVSGILIDGRTHNAVPGAPFVVNAGTENELSVSATGTNVVYKYWAGDVYKAGETYGCLQISNKIATDFIEVSLTSNSALKKMTTIKLNGTSSDATVGRNTNFIILYSDVAPFDVNRIIAYTDTCKLPESRNGSVGVTLTAPEGAKSFRITRKAFLNVVSENPTVYSFSETAGTVALTALYYNTRIAYVAATLATVGGTTDLIANNQTTGGLKFYSVNGLLKIYSDKNQNVLVHSLDGCLVKSIVLNSGDNMINDLKKGFYIINSQKVVVK